MQPREFNEWDFYPISLKPSEVSNPSRVFAEFFSDDWLPGHLERLKDWRDCILEDKYFVDSNNSPYGLLYFHKLNICLIEAVHLLKETGGFPQIIQQIENLKAEQENWRDYPSNLKEAELVDPMIIIKAFFEKYNLPEYRAHLYEWLEFGLSSKAANEFIETADLIRVHENLQRLYSAAWLIHQRLSDKPFLKAGQIDTLESEGGKEQIAKLSDKPHTDIVRVYRLNSDVLAVDETILTKLIAVIKHKVSSVQAVIYLGVNLNQPNNIYLLILTANDEQRQAQSLSSTIEESCIGIGNIVSLVHHASALKSGLDHGNPFFNQALTCQVVYLSGNLILPMAKPLNQFKADFNTESWERWQKQGNDFLLGAEYYIRVKAYGAALFSLHQCAEGMLIAVIRAVTGYSINNHNLSRLLNLTLMFTTDLAGVFNLADAEFCRLFNTLKYAYVNVRYKDAYEPDEKAVIALHQIIRRFVTISKIVYEKHFMSATL